MRTYYDVLGLPFGASAEQIRQRYKELARLYHPDVSQDPDALRKMQEINEAYRILSDPQLRLAYHLRLAALVLRKTARSPRPAAVAAPTPPLPRTYPRWMLTTLAALLGVVVSAAVIYHLYHPFAVKRAFLHGLHLSAWPVYLSPPPSLEWVDLSHNRLTGVPALLFEQKHLRYLSLAHNEITLFPGTCAVWAELEVLDLSHNRLKALPLGIGELQSLRVLDLSYNQLEVLPPEMMALPSLTDLRLRGNPLSPQTRAWIEAQLKHQPNLRILW